MKRALSVILTMVALAGCEDGGAMRDTPRFEAYEATTFFPDGTSARAPVHGTIAQEDWIDNAPLHTGLDGGRLVDRAPIELTTAVLDRGRERYDIYCSVCHGLDGGGRGMVVERGFTPPATFHQDRLRVAPDGYIFYVITHGFGRMPPNAAVTSAADRWAIVAYIRALQVSQHVEADALPQDARERLKGGSP